MSKRRNNKDILYYTHYISDITHIMYFIILQIIISHYISNIM